MLTSLSVYLFLRQSRNIIPNPKNRAAWDELGRDPYEVSPSNIQFMYLFRKVAQYNESTQTVDRIPTHYDRLVAKTNEPTPVNLTAADIGGYMPWEKYDLKSKIVSDTQNFMKAPIPPTSDLLEF